MPSTSADDIPCPVSFGSPSTASCKETPAPIASSNVRPPAWPTSRKPRVLNTSPITIASSSAFSSSPGRNSAAVPITASSAAALSARSSSSPETNLTRPLRPASASSPTSHATKSSTSTAIATFSSRPPASATAVPGRSLTDTPADHGGGVPAANAQTGSIVGRGPIPAHHWLVGHPQLAHRPARRRAGRPDAQPARRRARPRLPRRPPHPRWLRSPRICQIRSHRPGR